MTGQSKGFVIATDGRAREGEVLFLSDQRLTTRWWTNDLREAMVYQELHIATGRIKSIRHNNPRIISREEAELVARKPEMSR